MQPSDLLRCVVRPDDIERTALAEEGNRPVVVHWERRFREQGIEGLRG